METSAKSKPQGKVQEAKPPQTKSKHEESKPAPIAEKKTHARTETPKVPKLENRPEGGTKQE